MIQLLSIEVRDQIAAGEVVERPAHLIKELIENSLDAKADQITIRVSNGARNLSVLDNGSGIQKNQLGLALERFATSKITQTDDLWKLNSYGFRGEALASGSAVSQLTLTSRTREAEQGAYIKSEFGKLSATFDVNFDFGTEIKIEQLFENVPARLKFLKSEAAENQAVKQVIKAFALSHPSIEFKYFESDKLVLFYPKNANWIERCQNVLESKNQLFETEFVSDGWQAQMAFSSPQDVSKTSRQIWIFVQDRFVQDRALQTAITDAYRSLLMHGEYPTVVLNLKLPTDQVDVNIHPTKSQVKFLNPSQAFRTVHHALRSALEKAPWSVSDHQGYKPVVEKPFYMNDRPTEQFSWQAQDSSFQETHYRKKEFYPTTSNSVLKDESFATPATSSNVGQWSRLEVIGQMGLTYIVAQSEEGLVLVDQHAAHERVAFERLMSFYNSGNVQTQEFLFPLALDLSVVQAQAILDQTESFGRLGIKIDQLGPSTLGIVSAPLFMKEASLAPLFLKVANEILEFGSSFQFEKKLIDICATMACHSVVRAGQALSHDQMKSLLQQMDEFPLSGFCPHGRPVSIKWTLPELEKEFGRRN
jgi:DNA mismatch repair protein MutL